MPLALFGAAVLIGFLLANPARAAPDGAEWGVAEEPAGCGGCHLAPAATTDAAALDPPAVSAASAALDIEGLPANPAPGQRYVLLIALDDPALRNAGFLLSVRAEGGAPGRLIADDVRVETDAHLARSTWEGSFVAEPGSARWPLIWEAPAAPTGPVRFELWANAGNNDLSPLGDRVHHRVWAIPAGR